MTALSRTVPHLARVTSPKWAEPLCASGRQAVGTSSKWQSQPLRETMTVQASSSLPSHRLLYSSTSRASPVKFPSTTIKDPDHPSGLYYHKLSDSRKYAVSFLPEPPSSSTSASVIGYIDAPPSSEELPVYELAARSPDSFQANPEFITLMHRVLKEECVPQDGLLEYEAALRKSGWAHLNDQRHPLMPGRIATPENIIASVAFIDGELQTESYEINDVYRVVTAEEGFMDLRPNWLMFIKKRCEEAN